MPPMQEWNSPGVAPGLARPLSCAILANPAAGRLGQDRERSRLAGLARRLDCPVFGLDTVSPGEFREAAAEISRRAEVMLVAGGDGTFTDVLNSRLGGAVLGYLPFGTGNALRCALGIGLAGRAYLDKVRRREAAPVGVMEVNGARKALFASLGVDALTVLRYGELARAGRTGLYGYALAFARALADYAPGDLLVSGEDGRAETVQRNLAAIVSKHPFYGYGLRVNQGRITDAGLFFRSVSANLLALPGVLAAAALRREPRLGFLRRGRAFTVRSETDQCLQYDGEWGGRGREFHFAALPDYVRLIF